MTPEELWTFLGRVRASRFTTEGDVGSRQGSGQVVVRTPDAITIEWEETGLWSEAGERSTHFHDRLRWRRQEGQLALYHLRHGDEHPVHLADLRDEGEGRFLPTLPHLCAQDTYLAELRASADAIAVKWNISGPKKRYSIERLYR